MSVAYQKQVWREYDDTKTELQNALNGALATPERLNHIENGIANSADKAEVTAQLQQKADKSEVDRKIGELGAVATFKGSASNAVILAKTDMQVGDEWYDTTNNSSLRWNGESWRPVGSAIKLGDGAVTPSKLLDYAPKNILMQIGLQWQVDTLLDDVGELSSTSLYKTTIKIKLSHGQTHVTFSSDKNGVVGFFNDDEFLQYNLIPNDGTHMTGLSYQIPTGADVVVVSVHNEAAWYQLEYGKIFTGYDADNTYTMPKLRLGYELKPDELSDYLPSVNLLARLSATWRQNTVINPGGDTETSQHYKTATLRAESSQTHVTFASDGNGVVSFYTEDDNLLMYNLVPNDANFRNGVSFTIPSGTAILKVSVRQNATWYQVEYGDKFTGYDSGSYRLGNLDIGATKEYVDSKLSALSKLNAYAEIEMFTAYGQSWAQGYDTDAVSVTQVYDNLMLNTGVTNQPLDNYDQTATALVPLIEENGTAGSQKVGESPTAGQTNMVKMLIESENGYGVTDINYQLLGNSPGMGSTSMEQLSKGTAPYNRLVSQVQQAYTLAQAQGKTFKMTAFSWAQGAGGYAGTDYAQSLENLRADIEADVKAITGQKEPVKCITWQAFARTNNESETLYDRYVEASDRFEHIVCAGPTYHLATISKANLHFTAVASMHLGAYFGQAFKRTINDGVKFEPLKPIGMTVQGRIALIKFNNDTPLAFDTTSVSLAKDYGFKVLDGDGNDVTLYGSIDVSIVNNTIKIINVREWRDTDRIVYGDTGTGWGGTDGKRGNLRDSSTMRYQYLSHNLPMYNWCVVFDKTVSDLRG